MTRPVVEDSLERTDARLDYGQQQLFRRPGAKPGEYNSYCWIEHQNGSTTITTGTAYNIVNDGGAGNNPYDAGFIVDDDTAGFSVDLTTGVIQYQAEGMYYWHGSLQVNSDIDGVDFTPLLDFGVNGTFSGVDRAASLNRGAGDGGGGVTTTNRWAVDAVTYYSPITTGPIVPGGNGNCARLLIYQNSAGNWSAEEFVLSCIQISSVVTGTVSP